MAGAGLASCSQPIPSYTVMGNIPDSTFNGKTVYTPLNPQAVF